MRAHWKLILYGLLGVGAFAVWRSRVGSEYSALLQSKAKAVGF